MVTTHENDYPGNSYFDMGSAKGSASFEFGMWDDMLYSSLMLYPTDWIFTFVIKIMLCNTGCYLKCDKT